MDLDALRDQTAACIALQCPALAPVSFRLADQCLGNALRSFRGEFVALISPQAWARITVTYFSHFVDTASDVSVGEMFAAVIRDSVANSRMDMLTQQLAQARQVGAPPPPRQVPSLRLVRD